MLIAVKVKPNARKNEIAQQPDGSWLASVIASPVDGKANEAVIRLVAEHFHVPKSNVAIETGQFARMKRIRVTKRRE